MVWAAVRAAVRAEIRLGSAVNGRALGSERLKTRPENHNEGHGHGKHLAIAVPVGLVATWMVAVQSDPWSESLCGHSRDD